MISYSLLQHPSVGQWCPLQSFLASQSSISRKWVWTLNLLFLLGETFWIILRIRREAWILCVSQSVSLNKSWHILSKHVHALNPQAVAVHHTQSWVQTGSRSGIVTRAWIKFAALRQAWNLNSGHLQMSTVCGRQQPSPSRKDLVLSCLPVVLQGQISIWK